MSDLQAFHDLVRKGDLDLVRTALASDPSLLNAKNAAGQSAFLLAKYYGQQETAEYLLSLKPDLDFYNAAVAGWNDMVLEAIDHAPTLLEDRNSDGWTVLHLAVFFGNDELAHLLLKRGASPDTRSTNGMKNTPLHAAVAGKNLDAVSLLLENGANVNARQHGGWTALHGAAQNGDRAIVEILLAKGADLNARAENNQSPLDLAMLKGHHEVAELLDELGVKRQ